VDAFLDWQFTDFALGFPAFAYFQKAVSTTRESKTLKGYDHQAVTNAAWDLTLVQYWLYLLKTKPEGIHYLLCSFDGALRRAA
jgi:hypothetical protein